MAHELEIPVSFPSRSAARWQLTRNPHSAARSIEAHVCYYCGLDFNAARKVLETMLPLALDCYARGERDEAVRLLVGATKLPDRDAREILAAACAATVH